MCEETVVSFPSLSFFCFSSLCHAYRSGSMVGSVETFISHGNQCEKESCMRLCQGKGYQ